MTEDKDDNTENCTQNKRCNQDIESRGKGDTKWIHKELTKEEGPKIDNTREWTPGYYPEKEKECQACGYPNIKTENGPAAKDLKEFAFLIRRANTILGTERLMRQKDEASSKRQQKKIEKIIKRRQAKLTEAYDQREAWLEREYE